MACNCGGAQRQRNQVTSIEVVAMQEAERAAQEAADALAVKAARTATDDYLRNAAYEDSARATEEHFRKTLEEQAS